MFKITGNEYQRTNYRCWVGWKWKNKSFSCLFNWWLSNFTIKKYQKPNELEILSLKISALFPGNSVEVIILLKINYTQVILTIISFHKYKNLNLIVIIKRFNWIYLSKFKDNFPRGKLASLTLALNLTGGLFSSGQLSGHP